MASTHESDFEKSVREGEIDEAKSKAMVINMWNNGGGDRPVKVVPTGSTDQESVKGHITQEKFVKGRTPQEMEYILGFESGSLKNGATIYALTETPGPDQFVPHGYNQIPGGGAYEPSSKYPKGPGIPQWYLTEDVPAKVIGKVNYDESWVGQNVETQESSVSSSGKDELASKSVDQSSQLAKTPSAINSEDAQDEEYQHGYGY